MFIKPLFYLFLCCLTFSSASFSQDKKPKKGVRDLKEYIDSGGNFKNPNQKMEQRGFPKAKIITEEDLQEQKQNEESQKRYEAEQEARNRQARISNYPDLLLNDVFKFCFPVTILLAIFICVINRKGKGLEYYLPFLVLTGVYILHCTLYSKSGEFGDCFTGGIKVALISILFSIITVSALANTTYRKAKFTNQQNSFIVATSFLLSGIVAYLLTSNIESSRTDKSLFVMYPWNLVAFTILSCFLYYNFKFSKSKE